MSCGTLKQARDDWVKTILNNDNYQRNVKEVDADIVVFKKAGKVIHSGRRNPDGTYNNNAGILTTQYNKTLPEASRGLTDVSKKTNVEFDKKKTPDRLLNTTLGTVDKTTGIRTITDPNEIRKLLGQFYIMLIKFLVLVFCPCWCCSRAVWPLLVLQPSRCRVLSPATEGQASEA